jgi:hypothetical protein
MDGKMEQRVLIKFRMLSKSGTETLEILHEAFGEHSLSQTVVFEWHSRFKASRVSAEDDERSGQLSTTKKQKMFKKFENTSMKTVAKQSMSLQTTLGSVMEYVTKS